MTRERPPSRLLRASTKEAVSARLGSAPPGGLRVAARIWPSGRVRMAALEILQQRADAARVGRGHHLAAEHRQIAFQAEKIGIQGLGADFHQALLGAQLVVLFALPRNPRKSRRHQQQQQTSQAQHHAACARRGQQAFLSLQHRFQVDRRTGPGRWQGGRLSGNGRTVDRLLA